MHSVLAYEAGKIVKSVGESLRPHWGKCDHAVKNHPTDHDVVTKHDYDAEEELHRQLQWLDPTIGFTGEEEGLRKQADRFWLVDPIDGTDGFIRGLPFCTVQIALIENGQPIIGIVYDIVSRELVRAEKGRGTLCNGQKVSVSDRNLKTGKMVLETDVRADPECQRIWQEMRRRTNGLYQCFAAGWEFIQIACGRLEGRVSYKPWGSPLDFAPGVLLVQEAGGVATNIGKPGYDYLNTDIICGNPVVHRQLTEDPKALFSLT